MVRRSSSTLLVPLFCFSCISGTGIWFARAHIFPAEVLTIIKKNDAAIGESLFTLFASLTYTYYYLMTLIKKNSEY